MNENCAIFLDIRTHLWEKHDEGIQEVSFKAIHSCSRTTMCNINVNIYNQMISNNKQLLVLAAVWIVSCASIVDALANRKPFPIAPPVTASVYAETLPTLYTSNLVYDFADVVKGIRDEDFVVESPESFPIQDMSVFKEASLDFSDINEGKGLSLSQIYDFLRHNVAAMELICKDCLQDLKNYFESPCGCNNESGGGPASEVYLTCFRSIQREVSCVYGIVNDTCKKQVMVVFRGSQLEGRDWRTNADYRLEPMTTPSLVADKMNGKLKERVLVHRGFYGYLFDNENIEREQRYKRILKDIEPLFEDEEGYSLYITGHSLGGALAHMMSFQIAGAGEEAAFVPRPVNCITFAAPMSGTNGFRAAYEQMEQDKLLRSLRVNNVEDIVPSLFPISIGVGKRRLFRHTGMNLRLKKRGKGILIEHSSKNSMAKAVRNSMFGKSIVGSLLRYHKVHTYLERIERRQEALEATTLDELYQDTLHVGNYFHEGKMCEKCKDEE